MLDTVLIATGLMLSFVALFVSFGIGLAKALETTYIDIDIRLSADDLE